MGRYPLSRTDSGIQIKDEDEAKKGNYADVYRPPGLVKVKHTKFSDEPRDKQSSALSHTAVSQSQSIPSMFVVDEKISFGNANVEDREEAYNRKNERNIWLTVPQ